MKGIQRVQSSLNTKFGSKKGRRKSGKSTLKKKSGRNRISTSNNYTSGNFEYSKEMSRSNVDITPQ